jgi:steroid delta-isomerase-like uncharacterized protein
MVERSTITAFLSVLAILAAIWSCQPVGMEPPAGIDPVAFTQRGLPIWNESELDLIDELYVAGAVRHDTGASQDVVGIEALRGYATDLRTGFPDFHVTVDEAFVAGDRVVNRWTVTGTHEGVFRDQPPTGRSIQIQGVTISRVVDGRTAEEWVYWNDLTAWQQLGYSLTPPAQAPVE